MKTTLAALALASLALAACQPAPTNTADASKTEAAAPTPAPGDVTPAPGVEPQLLTLKLGVRDFKRSIAYYEKFFGMKEGRHFNAKEWGMNWVGPGHGPNIILWEDTCTSYDTQDRDIKVSKGADAMSEISGCKSKFRAGSTWLNFTVADLPATAAALRADGYKAEVVDVSAIVPMLTLVTFDPDGNTIEIAQHLNGKPAPPGIRKLEINLPPDALKAKADADAAAAAAAKK